jgi:phenylalanyl-tRNA synthetase beta chain
LPLLAPPDLTRAGFATDAVIEVENPLRAEESVLRTRILAGLLRAVAFNHAHGLYDVALFEQGHVFYTPVAGAGPLPEEPEHLAVAIAGAIRRRPVEDDRSVDVYDAVDALRAVVDALEIEEFALEPFDVPGYRPGRSARVLVGGADVGAVGEVAGAVVSALGLVAPVVAFEVVLDALVAAPRRDRRFQASSRFPASSIDLAFVVADTLPAAEVTRTLREASGPLLEDVRPFDAFQSDALGAGRRSVAFALRLRAPDHTLTDAEVGELRQRAIDAVTEAHGAELRT